MVVTDKNYRKIVFFIALGIVSLVIFASIIFYLDSRQETKAIQGQRGYQGPQGIQGATGQPGPKGPKGSDGSDGERGPTGLTGPQGIQGTIGAKGSDGEDWQNMTSGEYGCLAISMHQSSCAPYCGYAGFKQCMEDMP